MPAKLDIPHVFTTTDQASLKRELECFAQGVYKYTQDAANNFVPAPQTAERVAVLAFGAVTRVALAAGETLALQLPQPNVKNGNQQIYVKRETQTGTCTVRGVGVLINGRATKLLPAAPGLYTIFFDGVNYFSSPQLAADWGG